MYGSIEFSAYDQQYPPPALLPVLQKLKSAYLLWFACFQILPKTHRYSLGQRIDTLLVEAIEAVATAAFLRREEKQPYVRRAIQKTDTAKLMLMILWEAKSITDETYISLSLPLEETGRMLGGWNGQLSKQNSPFKKYGEK